VTRSHLFQIQLALNATPRFVKGDAPKSREPPTRSPFHPLKLPGPRPI
jgi:hypothetical protein